MKHRHIPLPVVCLLVAGCGQGSQSEAAAVLQNPTGSLRVLQVVEAQWKGDLGRKEMESALERFPQVDLVYAHNDPMAKGAYDAARQKGRTGIKIVGIDGLLNEGRKYVVDGVLDATVEYPTGGAAAVDLALLAIQHVTLPKDITLGTHVYTKANVAAGGERIASAGDIVLDQTRSEQQALLTPMPDAAGKWKIGMAQCTTDEPWRVQMDADIEARAKQYPQLQLILQSADDDTEKQRTLVRQFIELGCDAILVSPKESMALVAPCKEALAKGIPVIVLDRKLGSDDYTCFIGGDNLAIGRAAGKAIRDLLPNGGNIVELEGLMTSSPAQERHQGFVEALGLQPVKK